MQYMVRLHFPTSNYMVEYEALLSALRIALERGIHRLEARGDSQLIIDQVTGEAKCHSPTMAAYYREVRRVQEKFHGPGFVHLRLEYNRSANTPTKLASS